MILVDTSVWIDHLRSGDPVLIELLVSGSVLCHPYVVGELAMGNLNARAEVLDLLANLPQATLATDVEVMHLVESERLYGAGIGLIDAHLLASARLTPNATLWTKDRRLLAVLPQPRPSFQRDSCVSLAHLPLEIRGDEAGRAAPGMRASAYER